LSSCVAMFVCVLRRQWAQPRQLAAAFAPLATGK
jgi:hypothetical protein